MVVIIGFVFAAVIQAVYIVEQLIKVCYEVKLSAFMFYL